MIIFILKTRRKATGFKSLQLNCWEINQVTSKSQTDFLTKLTTKALNRKSEHHHKILHIQISLDTKFRLKFTILNFWTK